MRHTIKKIISGAIFFSIFSSGFFLASKSYSLENNALVGEITVKGNQFIKKKKILKKVKVRKNDVVVDPSFRADVDRLLETSWFSEVEVAQEEIMGSIDARGLPRVRVIFIVKERPTARRIDYKGNFHIKNRKLKEESIIKNGDSYDRFRASQEVQRLLSLYREEGYYNAAVKFYTSLNPKKNKVILTFFIKEGSRVLVKSIQVKGTSVFSERKIRRKFKKTRPKKVFQEESFQEDLGKVENFYKNKGYMQVKVIPVQKKYNEDRTNVDIVVQVEEGRLFYMGNYSFAGATLYTDKELMEVIALKSGKRYRLDKMEMSLQGLQELYADKGYLRSEIKPETSIDDISETIGKVNLHFSIHESSVVYVDRIYVDGNTYTKEQVLRREILLSQGDVFSAGKVRKSMEKLHNLGFLDDVQIDVQQPRAPDKADLVFTIVEGKPGVLSAGAGFSSVDGLVGTLQVQHLNFLGRAQRLNFLWEFGSRRQNYEISWTNPWFMGKRMSLGIDLFNTVRELPFNGDDRAYSFGQRGFGLRLGPRITEKFSLIHSYRFERERVFNVDPLHIGNADSNINIKPSDDIKSSITNGVVYDTRDNFFDASRGSRQVASVELAGGFLGGDINFYKPEILSAVYIPTFWKFVFTLSGRVAYIQRFGQSDDVPFSERFRVGGVDTVRGYDIGEIGVDGGRAMAIFNAEYKFPLVRERNRTILQGAFFADMGGSWSRLSDVNLRVGSRRNEMRSGAGFGIRFTTPVFPIRLDWGYGINHRTGEDVSQFYFTIGNIF